MTSIPDCPAWCTAIHSEEEVTAAMTHTSTTSMIPTGDGGTVCVQASLYTSTGLVEQWVYLDEHPLAPVRAVDLAYSLLRCSGLHQDNLGAHGHAYIHGYRTALTDATQAISQLDTQCWRCDGSDQRESGECS